ncbi:aspartate/tyrosine/aromatic aminotransferase [Desulfosporosinus orientis DSM 765]|uniref:Aspartate/tyrosine/aromatic aminotransferase n=1 Tax=Desulfosporosinus orientis (strain ATCC 19365 / DSM 765 / NCIMB 8382 / VKM B-1628 / Singapore I) TaxID=768706 RepID=G7WDG3_DESOD|nr:aminotransferase class I/II-fold pyridoxal phosphate-dependent enzyme [Desulfosporosinus orientis]AET67932.1 aspartate/tyrosine/aromatic aminotransferase [Desulfosporosinus orientis DSM 765]
MKINDFKLEVFFGKHEFTAPYLLTQSDCESMSSKELLDYEPGAKEAFLNQWLGYTEVQGNPELRRIIAGLYSTLSQENILVHVGAQEPIFNFMNAVLDKGDHVISQFPIYQSLYEVANAIGCEVSKWSIEHTKNGWAMNLRELEKLIQPNTKLIVLNSPNNPTGYTFSEEEIDRIAEVAQKHGVYVFCDEVYKGIELDGIKRPWFADRYEKGISLGVMSKAYGLAGLRIGWLAIKDDELMQRLIKMKHYTSICSSGPSEFLATIALKHSHEILERNLRIIKENIKIAEVFFAKYQGLFEFSPPMAGPVAFVKMNIDIPMEEFCNTLVEESGVLLLPASVYSYAGQYFRMGFGRANFSHSLKQFEQYLQHRN